MTCRQSNFQQAPVDVAACTADPLSHTLTLPHSPKVHDEIVVAHEIDHLHVLQVPRSTLAPHHQVTGLTRLLSLPGCLLPLSLTHLLLYTQ